MALISMCLGGETNHIFALSASYTYSSCVPERQFRINRSLISILYPVAIPPHPINIQPVIILINYRLFLIFSVSRLEMNGLKHQSKV